MCAGGDGDEICLAMQTLVLHGEQYLELKRAFPTAGTLLTTPRIIDIQDKGKAAVVVIEATSINADTQEVVAINEITTFVRGAGGFGELTPLTFTLPALSSAQGAQGPQSAVSPTVTVHAAVSALTCHF